ncbi:hypothetical protein BCT61_18260, partial [Vibrio breoganii]
YQLTCARFTFLTIIWDNIKMHKWVLVTHCWTSNLSIEVLENTKNDLQLDPRAIDCYVITRASEIKKLRTKYVTNPLSMGMYVNFPCLNTPALTAFD